MTPLRYKNTPGFTCTVFRKNFNQIFAQGGLWQNSEEMYTGIPGAIKKPGEASWVFQNKKGENCGKVTFAHIERYDDTSKWQGSQICELCCEVSEEVLMADGSYKKVKDIVVGDVVKTLNGSQKVVAVGKEEEKECVEVETADGKKQLQSTDHEILTIYGWKSYDDLISLLRRQDNYDKAYDSKLCRCTDRCAGALKQKYSKSSMLRRKKHLDLRQKCEAVKGLLLDNHNCGHFSHMSRAFHQPLICEPIQYCFGGECDLGLLQNNQVLRQLLCNQYLGLQQEHEVYREMVGLQGLSDFFVCKAQRDLGKGFELFADLSQEFSKHTLYHLLPTSHEQVPGSARHASSNIQGADDIACAQTSTGQLNSHKNCSSYIHLYGEQVRPNASIDQDGVLQLSGVVRHIPTDLPFCDKDRAPKYIHYGIRYTHPYTGSSILSEEIQLFLDSIKITPCGKKNVRSFTVETYNHYITKSGFVNKNCFDELTHFDRRTFFYMLSRNRSTCGVTPFVRATCNPDADSWVAEFISWWIDQDTGYPIPERSGKIRYFVRRDDQIYWADTKKELWEQFNLVTPEEKAEPRSVTFIMSSVYDNQELLKINPQYLANLKALPTVERERLLMGNWKIKPSAGLYFKRTQVGSILQIIPDDVIQWVRCWDLAASEKTDKGDPAYTAGVLIGKRRNGRYLIADVVNRQMSASDVRATIKHTAESDIARFKHVRIRIPQDPGQAGKEQAQSYIKFMSGYDITAVIESGSKESRATPMAAQWQAGNFDVVYGDWNDAFFTQLEGFPDAKFKDMVDAAANGFAEIELRSQFNLSNFF